MERLLDHEFIDAEGGAPERVAGQKVLDLPETLRVSAVVIMLHKVMIEHALENVWTSFSLHLAVHILKKYHISCAFLCFM